MSDLRAALADNARLRDQVDTQRQVIEAQSYEIERLQRIVREQDQHLSLHRYSARQRLLDLANDDGGRDRRTDYPI